MEARTRTLTPARTVALLLIAVLAVGLAHVRFAPDGHSMSVPAGAKAGDLVLEPCHYETEAGRYSADCGTLVVPENRADPHSRLIALPVTRIRARSGQAAEPIFRLEGGPGITNTKFENASRFADDHDVVLVGYRGVDGSSVLDCPEVESALEHSTDFLGERSMRRYADAFRSCADRLQHDGVDLAGYSLPERVDDLEAARVALGYGRVDLLSESAGTRTALIYAWRYPMSIRRSVMIGANPPGNFLWDPKTTDEQISRYADLCSKDVSCRGRTDDLVATLRKTASDIPDRWWFLPIKQGNVRIASFYGLVESGSAAAPISAPMTLGSWLSAAKGDPSGFWFMSLAADLVFPKSFVWGDTASAARADARAATAYFSSDRARGSIIGDPGTAFLWGGGGVLGAWPANPDENEYSTMRTSTVDTLVIGGALDFATPPQIATKELMPHLPNGHQVVLPGFGHTTDFWTYQPDAGRQLVNTFLDRGQVDDSRYRPRSVDFTPAVSQGAIAKIVAGALLGLAVVVLVSLAWMARRVHRRGRFGPKSSAILRSAFAFLLGCGGWALGVLIVLMTVSGVPVDDELLVLLSVGVPVGLGAYLAWVHRDWPTEHRRVGLAAAAAGALAGAWLGFHATSDALAVLTAIAGAVGGANLLLILLDVSRTRPLGPPTPAMTHGVAGGPVEVMEPEPASR